MNRLAGVLIVLAGLGIVAPAPAQLIFSKKVKTNPTQRVPELILILKTDPEERKRIQAAEELRDYDTATFTEIVPVLVDVMLHDKKPGVRSEALASLAKIRPVTTLAGQAMEKVAAEDESLRIRWQAKTALPKYHLAGYSPRKTDASPAKKKQTEEPPVASGGAKKPAELAAPRPTDPTPPSVPRATDPASSSFPRPLPAGAVTPKTPSGAPIEGPSLFPK